MDNLSDGDHPMHEQGPALGDVWRGVRDCWKQLAGADIAYKVVAFIVLTPLMGLLFRLLVTWSGRTVVADQDIVQFLLEPLGWICLVVVGGVWIAIVALEQAALIGVLNAHNAHQHLGVVSALRFAVASGSRVLRVTTRIVVFALLAALPFLAVAGIAYLVLLTEFDINYYLAEKPAAFKLAGAMVALLSVGLAAVLLRLATSWFYALPLVLFEDVPPNRALAVSRDRVQGHRAVVLAWIVGWLAAGLLLSAAATGLVTGVAQWLFPRAIGSMSLLLFVVGATLLAWILVNLAVNLLGTASFAVVFFRLYADRGCPRGMDASHLAGSSPRADALGRVLTGPRLAAGLLVLAVLAAGIGLLAIRSVRTSEDVRIIAHRGASAAAPENTMAAIRQAVVEQADWAEIDVQETADGHVVVMHDSDFKKSANVNLKIWEATLEDLGSIDVGSWFDARFADERVPTLDEVLRYCKGRCRVTIELKYYGHDQQLEQRVANLVEAAGMASDVEIISLKQEGLRKMEQIQPGWRTGLLTAVAAGDLTKVDADFLAVNASIATGPFIRSAHRQGKNVLVWTVNDPLTMSTMIGRGVDGLITDRPGLAREVLEARRDLSNVERMLIQVAGVLGVQRDIAGQ